MSNEALASLPAGTPVPAGERPRLEPVDLRTPTHFVPTDHSRQVNARYYVQRFFREHPQGMVLDLGCGAGEALTFFEEVAPQASYYGIDIEISPEVKERKRQSDRFYTYDGIHLPFEDNTFDLIFCKQVLEHVRYPRELLQEVARVLTPDGWFVGSTSHLEPYHSFSTWNYTPFGFYLLCEQTGLDLKEVRPGIDGLTLITRRLLRCPRFMNRYWSRESPLNQMIGLVGRVTGKNPSMINREKLLFCGQFAFMAAKKAAASRQSR